LYRGDTAGARDRFACVEGKVTGCSPFCAAALEAVALCGLGDVDSAEQRLLDALSLRAPDDLEDTRALFDLLSDPPIPGINRLRSIMDSAT
jgi:hypothetical protein